MTSPSHPHAVSPSRPLYARFCYPWLSPPDPDQLDKEKDREFWVTSLNQALEYLRPRLLEYSCHISFPVLPVEGRWCQCCFLVAPPPDRTAKEEVVLSHSIPLLIPDSPPDIRRYGSILSYLKRYALFGMLGWPMPLTEEDPGYKGTLK